jgi:hypothetical protein
MLATGLVVVAVTAALVTLLLDSGDAAEKAASPATTTRSTTKTTDQAPTTEPTTTTPTTTTPTTTTVTPPPQQQQPQQPQQQPQQPATPDAAISAYYALMPGNLDQAWTRLTPKFQAHPAGGRSGYEEWWSTVSTVACTQVTLTGSNTVEATILYTFTSGERRRELHRYTLVNQNGVWLIDAVTVVSSTPV